jgi:excisionase family DNA binding protein
MAQVVAKFPPRSVDNHSFGIPDFEPLLNSQHAAQLLDIHPKTLQKLARRGEIHGSHVGKMWRFRASDLNECWTGNDGPVDHRSPKIPLDPVRDRILGHKRVTNHLVGFRKESNGSAGPLPVVTIG